MRKILLITLISIVLSSLSCRSETETTAQNEPENVNSVQSKSENKLTDKTKLLKELKK